MEIESCIQLTGKQTSENQPRPVDNGKDISELNSNLSYQSDYVQLLEPLEGQLESAGDSRMDRQSTSAEKMDDQIGILLEMGANVMDGKKWKENSTENVVRNPTKINSANGMEDKGDRPKSQKKKVKGMKALHRWFGDESVLDINSSDSDVDTIEWDTVDRKRRNKAKKKAAEKKKLYIIEQTNWKTEHILGLGPISSAEIQENMKTATDYESAKKMAVKDFLSNFLMFEQDNLVNLTISETMVSAKGDDVVYVVIN